MDNERKPWERQPGEGNLWYDRFTQYRLKGSSRSLGAVYDDWRAEKGRKRTGKPATSWRRNWKKWRWEERAAAWDEHLRQEDEAKWLQRREERRERRWELGDKLEKKGEQMLMFPLARTERETHEGPDGKTIIYNVVNPVDWRLRDAPTLLKTANELFQQALGEAQHNRILNIDVKQLTIEQLERIAAGEDPIHVLATTASQSRTGETAAQ